jgi:HAD superfamily hydrolase (TIGR01509 family)
MPSAGYLHITSQISQRCVEERNGEMTAILFGSIGALADTSELQRASFNEAFKAHDLDWDWSQDEYRELLKGSGGQQRIADYARQRGEDVDAGAVHATKSQLFQRHLEENGVQPRPGVAETIEAARRDGVGLALVTTTSGANISALAKALSPAVDIADFTVVIDREDVVEPKPAPEAYELALARLGETAATSVAIEDNVGGVQAAGAAGIAVVAFPGVNNSGHDFGDATANVDTLSPDQLLSVAGGSAS